MAAAHSEQIVMVIERVRLGHGADINMKDMSGQCTCPWQLCARAAMSLGERAGLGTSHWLVLQDGLSVLACIVPHGLPAIVAELVRLGADINAKDNVRLCCSCARGPRRARRANVRSTLPLPGIACTYLGLLTARCAERQYCARFGAEALQDDHRRAAGARGGTRRIHRPSHALHGRCPTSEHVHPPCAQTSTTCRLSVVCRRRIVCPSSACLSRSSLLRKHPLPWTCLPSAHIDSRTHTPANSQAFIPWRRAQMKRRASIIAVVSVSNRCSINSLPLTAGGRSGCPWRPCPSWWPSSIRRTAPARNRTRLRGCFDRWLFCVPLS
jgi:hypothetical protein